MTRSILLLSLIVYSFCLNAQQNSFPEFTEASRLNPEITSSNTAHTLLVYGALHCGYSQHLIKNLHGLEKCNQLNIVLVIAEPADSILKYMDEAILKKYPVYTNSVLKYAPKKTDIFPQTILFRDNQQQLYFKGLKKNMLLQIAKKIDCR